MHSLILIAWLGSGRITDKPEVTRKGGEDSPKFRFADHTTKRVLGLEKLGCKQTEGVRSFINPPGVNMRRALPLFLVFFSFVASTPAQHFDLEKDRLPISDLNGPWRFQIGDDMRWADPAFDDSGWKLLKPDQPWSASGEKDAGGFGWYRFTVRIPADIRDPSLFLPQFATSMQVFANGKLINQVGEFPPHQRIVIAPYLVSGIPTENSGTRDVIFAVRTWHWHKGDGYGPGSDARVGAAGSIDLWARKQILEGYWYQSSQIAVITIYLLGSGGLLLYFLRPSEREFLWFGLYELLNAATYGVYCPLGFLTVSYPTIVLMGTVFFSIKDWVWILFLETLSKGRRNWALMLARAAVLFIALVSSYAPLAAFFHQGQVPFTWGNPEILTGVGNIFYDFGILYPLYRAMRARVPDTGYLFWTFALFRGALVLRFFSLGLADLGWWWPITHMRWFFQTTDWPVPMGVWPITEFLTQVALLAILGLRFARSRRDQERLTAEVEAARAVQHLLIPEEIPLVRGFAVETAYKPAGEVGGDFFQVLASDKGGLLAVIGDVSGKGMPAAMTVSLLVGTFRTLAHYTQSPSEILAAMNQRMIGRHKHGFVTCLVLRVDADGTLTAANAGHLAPYCDGEELALANGLPLGLEPNVEYTESFFQLPEGAQLTLITDGVVEARAKDGELFGFDRSKALAVNSAEQIAQTAQAFGQEDDITVLQVTRRTKGEQEIALKKAWLPTPA